VGFAARLRLRAGRDIVDVPAPARVLADHRPDPGDLVSGRRAGAAGSIGTKVAVAGALLAVWWWRRAHPLDIATATTTALLAITPSFGTQYLLWQAPSATARPARLSIPLQIVLGAYAAIFYLPMQMLTHNNWVMANALMMLISLFVIAFMIAALPWQRRQWHPPEPRQNHEAERATDTAAA
jgi:hypothetical protein